MSDVNNSAVSAGAGSAADDLIKVPAADANTGQTNNQASINLADYVPKKDYEELSSRLGTQGNELGEARSFIRDISPLIESLQEMPEFAQAIVEGKIDKNLAQAIIEGKVNIGDATTVAKAHEEVKKDLGKKDYDKATTEEIERLVDSKMATLKEEIKKVEAKAESKISGVEERRQFEKGVDEFIKSTPDFPEFAEDVTRWLDQHTDQFDIATAYYAVKGQKVTELARKEQETKAAEAAKELAANAAGGQSKGTQIIQDENLVDQLIGGRHNPNI